jgi:hypothetical protein
MYKIIGADQKEYGPIAAEQIRQWVAEGRLNGLSKIQVEGSGVWRQLRDMPEFSALLPRSPQPINLGATSQPSPAAAPSNNPLAGWALGTGIASLTCCPLLIFSPISIVLGVMALSRIKQHPNQGGRGLAIAGIVLGCISLLMGILSVGFFIVGWRSQPESPFFR